MGEGVRTRVELLQREVEGLLGEKEELQKVVDEEEICEKEQVADLERINEYWNELRTGNNDLKREKNRLEKEVKTAEEAFEAAIRTVETEESALKDQLLVATHKLSQARLVSTHLTRTNIACTASLTASIQACQSRLVQKQSFLASLQTTLSTEATALCQELQQVPPQAEPFLAYLTRL